MNDWAGRLDHAVLYDETVIAEYDSNVDETCTQPFLNPLEEFLTWPNPTREVNVDPGLSSHLASDVVGHGTNDADNINAHTLHIHRGHVFKEMIEAFVTHNIEKTGRAITIQMIMPNGKEELAVDEGGVFRDALSEFWNDFFEQCTLGSASRVPQLRHDFDEKKWQAVASILYRGWKEANYFPIEISQCFMEIACFRD